MMTTYPDPDDMTAAKRGSDHDRADAWRILAHEERETRRKAEDAFDRWEKTWRIQVQEEYRARHKAEDALARIDRIVFDVPRTSNADSAVMDIARIIAEHDEVRPRDGGD